MDRGTNYDAGYLTSLLQGLLLTNIRTANDVVGYLGNVVACLGNVVA